MSVIKSQTKKKNNETKEEATIHKGGNAANSANIESNSPPI